LSKNEPRVVIKLFL